MCVCVGSDRCGWYSNCTLKGMQFVTHSWSPLLSQVLICHLSFLPAVCLPEPPVPQWRIRITPYYLFLSRINYTYKLLHFLGITYITENSNLAGNKNMSLIAPILCGYALVQICTHKWYREIGEQANDEKCTKYNKHVSILKYNYLFWLITVVLFKIDLKSFPRSVFLTRDEPRWRCVYKHESAPNKWF